MRESLSHSLPPLPTPCSCKQSGEHLDEVLWDKQTFYFNIFCGKIVVFKACFSCIPCYLVGHVLEDCYNKIDVEGMLIMSNAK